jgi:hypothetical protein
MFNVALRTEQFTYVDLILRANVQAFWHYHPYFNINCNYRKVLVVITVKIFNVISPNQLSYSIEQCPSSEGAFYATRRFIFYRVLKNPPKAFILNHVISFHSLPAFARSALILWSHLHLHPLSVQQKPIRISNFMQTCCVILLDLFILMTYGEEYKLWRCSCNNFHKCFRTLSFILW